MVVALKGYSAVGETGLYVSDKREWRLIGRTKGIKINRVASLRKYTIPSEDDIVDLLVEKAYELRADPEKEGSLESELKKLNSLQENILEDIRNRNAERMLFLKKNTRVPPIKEEGERTETVLVRYAILPYQIADQIKAEGLYDEDKLFFDERLKRIGLGHQWFLNLLLVNGLLPSRKVMRTLIGSGASISKFHEIRGENASPREVMGIINLLYESVPVREKIRKIKDTTESALEDLAKEPITQMLFIEDQKREKAKKAKEKEIEEAKQEKQRQERVMTGKIIYTLPENIPN